MMKRFFGAVALVCALGVALAGGAHAQNTTTFGNIVSMGVPCGAANCVYYQLPPATAWVNITVAGTWTGTLEVAATSAPNANYANLDTVAWTALATESVNGTWSASTSGTVYLRVRATSWSGGTARVDMASSAVGSPQFAPLFQGPVAGSSPGGTNAQAQYNNNGSLSGSAMTLDAAGNINTPGTATILQSVSGLPSSQVGIFIGGLTSAAPNSVVLDVFPPGFGSFTNGIVFEDYATSGAAITLGESGSGNQFSQAIKFVTGYGNSTAILEGRDVALYAPNDSTTVAALECGSQVSGASCFYDAENRAQFGYLNGYAWIHSGTGHFVGFDWNDVFGGTTPKAWFDDGGGSTSTLHVDAIQAISGGFQLTGIVQFGTVSSTFTGTVNSTSTATEIAQWGIGAPLQTQYACYDSGRGCVGFDGTNGNTFLGNLSNSKGWELLYQPVSGSGIGTVSLLGDTLGNVGVGTNANPLLDSFFVTAAGAVTAASVASAGVVTGATGSLSGGFSVSTGGDSPTNAAILVGTGAAATDFMGFAGSRTEVGFNGTNAVIQGGTSKGVQFGVNTATFGSGIVGGFDSSGNFYVGTSTTFSSNSFYVNAGSIVNSTIKSTTGTRFVCVDTTGKLVSSASACSGT